jgi:hypothetical protein
MPVFLSVMLLSGCATPSQPIANAPDGDIYVVNCVTFEQKPIELVLYCADAGQILDAIKWSTWTNQTATGVGTSTANTCEPSCVDGNYFISQVEIKLTKPVTASDGKRVFSEIEVQYDKVQPNGTMDETLGLPTDIFR